MPTVLITRPQAASEKLAAKLERLGYATVIEPLLSVAPTHAPLPTAKNFDAVIVTSMSVFPILENVKSDIAHLLDLPCFCVGTTTATHARAFGFKTVEDAEGDGAALAGLLQNRKDASQFSLLHICGTDVSPEAQRALQDEGYDLTLWPVYTAKMSHTFSAPTLEMLEQGQIDATLLFSPRTSEALQGILVENTLEACCKSMIAIGISDAALTALRLLSWRELAAVSVPTEDAVVTMLQTLVPVSVP